MKLRQKLAVALATAMVVTSVPVVTIAKSVNKVSNVVTVKENTQLDTTTGIPKLRINLEDYDTTLGEVFYLKLENAKWTTTPTVSTGVTFTKINDTEARIDVATGLNDTEISISLPVEVKTGEAKVSVIDKGNTTVSQETIVFATTSDKSAKVSIDKEIPAFYKEGEIADITFEETFQNAFAGLGDKNKIELTIQNSDYQFVAGSGSLVYEYGFSNSPEKGSILVGDVLKFSTDDKQVLVVELPTGLTADSIGHLKIKGLKVKSTSKTPEMGELKIDIDGASVIEQRDVVVGQIAKYGNTLSVKDDKAVEIVAGQSKAVEFTLKENVKESMTGNREVEFKLDKGYFAVEDEKQDDDKSRENLLDQIISIKNATKEEAKEDMIKDVIIEDKKVVGFTMELPTTSNIDEFNIKANVFIGLEEAGDVTLSVSGRAIGEELSAVIVKAKKSIDVTCEEAGLKVGLKGQETGKITVNETEKAMINKGDLEILLPSDKGINFAKAPEVKVTGDLQVGEVTIKEVKDSNSKVIGQKVIVPVKRVSKTASTIEISNFTIDVDRTVAQGTYDVKVGGNALTANNDNIKLKDFINIKTTNTEDIMGANGLRKGTSTFVVGESKYVVNGEEKVMDAKSYIQNPGYTMVPVRFVAEAFGVTGNNIMFNNGTATFFAGTRTIQLTNNSDIAIVNGVQIKMATKVVMKDGRTFAPIGEVAQLLGISKEWDNTTKTATFINK